jgi:hypothetical protein
MNFDRLGLLAACALPLGAPLLRPQTAPPSPAALPAPAAVPAPAALPAGAVAQVPAVAPTPAVPAAPAALALPTSPFAPLAVARTAAPAAAQESSDLSALRRDIAVLRERLAAAEAAAAAGSASALARDEERLRAEVERAAAQPLHTAHQALAEQQLALTERLRALHTHEHDAAEAHAAQELHEVMLKALADEHDGQRVRIQVLRNGELEDWTEAVGPDGQPHTVILELPEVEGRLQLRRSPAPDGGAGAGGVQEDCTVECEVECDVECVVEGTAGSGGGEHSPQVFRVRRSAGEPHVFFGSGGGVAGTEGGDESSAPRRFVWRTRSSGGSADGQGSTSHELPAGIGFFGSEGGQPRIFRFEGPTVFQVDGDHGAWQWPAIAPSAPGGGGSSGGEGFDTFMTRVAPAAPGQPSAPRVRIANPGGGWVTEAVPTTTPEHPFAGLPQVRWRTSAAPEADAAPDAAIGHDDAELAELLRSMQLELRALREELQSLRAHMGDA